MGKFPNKALFYKVIPSLGLFGKYFPGGAVFARPQHWMRHFWWRLRAWWTHVEGGGKRYYCWRFETWETLELLAPQWKRHCSWRFRRKWRFLLLKRQRKWRFLPSPKSPKWLAPPSAKDCSRLLQSCLCCRKADPTLGWIAKSSGAFTVAPTVLAFPTSQIASSNDVFLPPRHVSIMHEVAIRNGASHAGDVQKQHPLRNTFQTALKWE